MNKTKETTKSKRKRKPPKAKTQKTDQGYEIPVPTRGQFLGDLKKATRRTGSD